MAVPWEVVHHEVDAADVAQTAGQRDLARLATGSEIEARAGMPLLAVAERHPEVVHLDGSVVHDELDRRERAVAAQPADAFMDDLTVALHPAFAEELVSTRAAVDTDDATTEPH